MAKTVKTPKTFTQRVSLRVNTVLVALERLGKISNSENVVSKADQAKIVAAIKPAYEKAMAQITTADRQASGFTL